MHPTRAAVCLFAVLLAGCSSGATSAPTRSPSAAPSASANATANGHASAAKHFTYEGAEGPERWGDLDASWGVCKTGRSQSPIDLTGAKGADLPNLQPAYGSSTWTLVNTGHGLQAVPAEGSTLSLAGATWSLKQFHLHTPSEHLVDNKAAAGELHLVHAGPDGRLLVVGVLLTQGTADNPAWSWLSGTLPTEPGAKGSAASALSPAILLPSSLAHETYLGSLTTPPCTEGVTWVVLEKPVALSASQLARVGAMSGDNARPVQPLNGRTLQEDSTP